VTAVGPCGNSQQVCIPVSVYDIPNAVFAAPLSACAGSAATIEYRGNASLAADYEWTFTGGTPSAPAGPGPHQVSWSNAGTYAVSLVVTENGCSSPQSTQIVQVQAPLLAPVINCTATSYTSLLFTWNGVPGAIDYGVRVLTGQTGTQNIRNYFLLENLSPGEIVVIEVTARSGNSCPDVTATLQCSTLSCPTVILALNPVCESAPAFPILIPRYPNLRWSGPGIDPGTGHFHPARAGAGTHYLHYYFEDGSCIYADSTSIDVFSTPALVAQVQAPIWSTTSDGSIDLSVNAATALYSVIWNNGSTADDLQNVPIGTYCVAVRDERNCEKTGCYTISAGTYSLPPVVVMCRGDRATLSVSPQTGATFHWSPTLGLSCTDCPNPTVRINSSYARYQVTATLPDGRFATTSVLVIALPRPFCNSSSLIGQEVEAAIQAAAGSVDLATDEEIAQALKPFTLTDELLIYPNPAQNVLNVLAASPIQAVEVYDFTHWKLLSQAGVEDRLILDVSELPAGQYVVKVYTSTGLQMAKVQVMR
jgi:hypothetical protein